jgi:tetratricopeptide (TPR) repeat protein
MSRIRRQHDWDWSGAEQFSRRALELAPGSAEALGEAGVLAHALCRFERAAELVEQAVLQDPLSSRAYSQLALIYRAMDRIAEAESAWRKALELAPQRITSHMMLAILAADQGRAEEALREANLESADWARMTALAYVHSRAGREAEAEESLRQLEATHAGDSAYQIAAVYAARGDADSALAWLDRGAAARDAGVAQAYAEPIFRSLHHDPRWSAFVKRIGFTR